MNDLKVFKNSEFGSVRTITVDGEPYFVGIDVADKLEYQNGSRDINAHVDECDRKIISLFDGKQNRKTTIINESGFYSLVFQSKMKKAKQFKHWVTSEVLPSIRKTGSYNKPMTTAEKIHLLAQSDEELTHRVDEVEAEVEELKETMPLLAVDCDRITNAVKAKGVETLGGKDSNSYKNRSLRGRVYADIHREVKRQFGVTTYKAIKRNQCEKAVAFVRNYNVPFVLQEEIAENNAQLNLEVTA